jgi:hypothetical protein
MHVLSFVADPHDLCSLALVQDHTLTVRCLSERSTCAVFAPGGGRRCAGRWRWRAEMTVCGDPLVTPRGLIIMPGVPSLSLSLSPERTHAHKRGVH